MNEFSLKLLAAAVMLVDHLTVCFLEKVPDASGKMLALSSDPLYLLDRIGRSIGRSAFPIFAFCIVEGFFHTRSRGRYLVRLLLAAVVSQLPFSLVYDRGPFAGGATGLNTLATLALGFCLIWAADRIAGGGRLLRQGAAGVFRVLCVCICTAGAVGIAEELRLDYGGAGILTILLFYLIHGLPRAGYVRWAPLAVWVFLGSWSFWEWFALPGCLLLCFYNGERGKKSKYFFYLFYPVHLLILWMIRYGMYGF